MPAPWRALLLDFAEVQTGSALYERFKTAFLGAGARELPAQAVAHWDADQEKGRIEIECTDGAVIHANFEILGTHTGREFLWADANKSIARSGAAKRVRESLGKSDARQLGEEDQLPLGLRDVRALLALAGDALSAQNTFLACSRNVSAAMILSDVSLSAAHVPAEAPGLVRRLFGAGKDVARQAEQLSPLQMMQQLIQRQVDAQALAPERLVRFDVICADVHADCVAGRFGEALNRIAQGKRELGRFFIDQEPAGWLLYSEGVCRLANGELAAANQAFRDAGRALVPPSFNLVRLGLARAAATDALRRSSLSALHIGSPSWFAEHVTAEEALIVRVAQGEAEAKREGVADDAEAVLRAALAERCALEVRAHEWSEAAKAGRTQAHVLCASDVDARDRINAEYRDMLLRWFDVPRDPSMGSWSSHPGEDPAALQSLTAVERGEQEAVFVATYKTPHGSTGTYRYKLIRMATPSSERALWRIAEVWSVWPDEDIRLL
jgi:ribosomal protein L25 (general stress protein Ctc)